MDFKVLVDYIVVERPLIQYNTLGKQCRACSYHDGDRQMRNTDET